MTPSSLCLKPMHARPRIRGRVLAALAVLTLSLLGAAQAAERVKGEVKVSTEGGFARLVFRLDEPVEAGVRVSNSILVISFKKPVDISVDRLNLSARDYISVARSDPDGTAIRIALSRELKVNTIAAAERFYVDLLPPTWAGVMPGLPQEVIDDLARRARNAERQLHKQRIADRQRTPPVIRVRVATQPTFVRYVFEMPETVNVVPESGKGKYTLNFDQPINWDLADAKATLPTTLESIDTGLEPDSSTVKFVLNGTPGVRSFREDRSIVVDVDRGKPKQEAGPAPQTAAPAIAPPDTVPAKDAPQLVDAPPLVDAPAVAPAAAPVPPPKVEANPPPKVAINLPLAPTSPAPAKAEPKLAAAPAVDVPAAKPATAPAVQPSAKAVENAPLTPAPAPPVVAEPNTSAPVAEAAPPTATPAVAEPAPKSPAPVAAAAPPVAEAPKAPKAEAQSAPKSDSKSAAVAPAHPAPNPDAPVVVGLQESGKALRLEFPFAVPTPAAVFLRADMLWLVFDSTSKINLAALKGNSTIRGATFERNIDGAAIVRIRLAKPQLASLDADGPGWILVLGDTSSVPTNPLAISRSIVARGRASITIPFDKPSTVHVISDPDIGDRLTVVTALGPARGFLKAQYFVELRALASTHGVVIQPIADDITTDLESDKIMIGRPGGLSLSSASLAEQQQITPSFRVLTFDTQLWGFDRQAPFSARQSELIRLAAAAPEIRRKQARFNLARFYLARDMASEAKAVVQVALADSRGSDDVTGSVLKAVANVMLDRPEDALKDLSNPSVGNQQDAPIWRAIAFSRQGKWAEAREAFKNTDATLGALPIELQRMAMQEQLRSAIEMRDFTAATRILNEFETIGISADLQPSIDVLAGRLYEGLGRKDDALSNYRAAAAAPDRRAAAQGRLREIELEFAAGGMQRAKVISELETLTTVWRGDETETEGLKLLAHLYTEDGRYRDAFHVMRTAMMAHPNSGLTRMIQDEAAKTFDSLFLAGKGDVLPPIEALGLFYDYRELTPIGRRGDEMIRRLADRLVAVDLLDQAAELLQHQVDHRLQGAARAQVATRLAVIYLMNRKPDRALATLQKTRTADLSNELRDQRLLLEARALSDVGRHEVALELIANIKNREAVRLRADILWSARRWRQAAEQIELLYGDRWREFKPLDQTERDDILRAAIGYSLAEESISLTRLRDRYAPKMADGPDRRAFDVVSAPIGASGPEFQSVARKVAGMNTLDAFMRDMRARYPDSPAVGPAANPPAATGKDAAPPPPNAAKPDKSATNGPGASALPAKPPAGVTPKPETTGSILPRLPKPRVIVR